MSPVYDDKGRTSDTGERPGASGQQTSAKDILGRERAAAAGKAALGSGAAGGKLTDGKDGDKKGGKHRMDDAKDPLSSRNNLTDAEKKSGMFKPMASAAQPLGRLAKFLPKGKMQKRVATAGLLAGLIGGGGGFAALGVVSGPLQFIHAARLLDQIHMVPGQDQQDMRMTQLAMYAYYYRKGGNTLAAQNTRLGVLGTYLSNKTGFVQKFENSGIRTAYSPNFGFANGYMLDPEKIAGGEYDKLRDRTPGGLQRYLKDNLSIDGQIRGGQVYVDTTQNGFNYRANKRLTREFVKVAGYKGLTGVMVTRYASIKGGWYGFFHPFKKMDAASLRKADAFLEWRKKRYQATRQGVQAPTANVNIDGEDEEARERANSQQSDVEEFIEEQQEASREIAEGTEQPDASGKTGAFSKFANSLSLRFGLGVAGVIGMVCMALTIADRADEINKANVEDPLKRVAAVILGTGSQIESGVDLDGQTDQMGFVQKLFYDPKTGSNWFDNQPLNGHLGNPGVGTPMPEEAKPKVEGNVLTEFLKQYPGARDVCGVVNSTLGIIVLTGLSLIAAPFSAIASALAGIIAGPLLIEYLASMLSGSQIKDASGGVYGAYAMYGGRLASNDTMLMSGAGPVSEAVAAEFVEETEYELKSEFQSKSLAYRLFDAHDPHSAFGKFVDRQAPEPGANTRQYAMGLASIPKAFGSIFTKPLFAMAGAQSSTGFNYEIDRFLMTDDLLNFTYVSDRSQRNPYARGEAAAAVLEQEQAAGVTDGYIARAKKCFNATLQKMPADPANPADTRQVWAIDPAASGKSPLYKDVRDPANKCFEDSVAWKDIRNLIFSSPIANGAACFEGDTESCKHSGIATAADSAAAAQQEASTPPGVQ